MKTRIISGIILGAIVAAVLTLGVLVHSAFIIVGVAAISAIAAYELLHHAAGVNDKATLIGAMVFSALAIICYPYIPAFVVASVVYFVYSAVMVLKNHKEFNLAHIMSVCAFPIILSFGFFSLVEIIGASEKFFLLLLLLNCSCVCDMGAYFVGVTLGKHKLCPELSPKKTVEGAIGGFTSALVVSVILGLCYSKNLLLLLPATLVLCAIGIVGDLFASAIKRTVGIKDYGTLIPGHGGILDRFDSILMLAPVIFVLNGLGVI